jgi:superfamily I DNA and/or RNA helicase/predicted RNA-binding protein with RPS1 domain
MSEVNNDIEKSDFPRKEITTYRLTKMAVQYNIALSTIIDLLNTKGVIIGKSLNSKITEEQYALFLEALGESDKELEFQNAYKNRYKKGTEVEVEISDIIPPSQIVTKFPGNFTGRLSLMDISWCLPEAQQNFSSYQIGNTIKCSVLDIDFKNRQIKLSQKHLGKPHSDSVKWERIDRGDEMIGTITEDLNTSYVVKSNKGFYGIINKTYCTEKVGNSIKLRVQIKSDENDLISFVPAALEVVSESENPIEIKNEFGFIESDLQNFNSFKRSILGAHASDNELVVLRDAFQNYPNLFSKEIEVPHTLFISFELKSSSYEFTFKQNAIPYFLIGEEYSKDNEVILLEKLSNQTYWARFNQRMKEDAEKTLVTEFSLFNEDINFFGEVLISKDKKEYRFIIKNFSFGQSFRGASEAKKRNTREGTFLFRSPIKIISPFGNFPVGSSQKEILEAVITKTQCFETVRKLKQDAGEILRQEGRTLAIIDKFLEYQESLLESTKGASVFVDKFERAHSESGNIAVLIDQSIADSLEVEEETIVNVKLKQGDGANVELVKFTDGVLSCINNRNKLTFFREIDTSHLVNGFYLEKRISKRQLEVQREIIQDFLQKKIKIDHIESLLVQPDKIKTPVLSKINLINPDLVRTEKEQQNNNQIQAVRKAIGNQNIFLIQGPPGTGKTTVIAEIIEQLVAKGEKILVAGQNHVAVDNVLSKIAKIHKLNLLRVGKEEKIDKELGRFHIDQLMSDYRGDFISFLLNQVNLIKHFSDCLLKKMDREESIVSYNERVKEYCKEYKVLTEILKHKHFVLRDGLMELSLSEIEETTVAFENWIKTINNEIEILLKPLIYNSVDVVFATCIGIKTDSVFRDSEFRFDTIIIDEAGKANIAETLVAIELGKKVILVGDQMQLPPYMDSSLIDINDPKSFPKSEYGTGFSQDEIIHALKTSFFEFLINRIENGGFPKENLEMLNYQHRMHPNIGEFISKSFYGGKVLMGALTHLNKLDYPSPFNKEVVFFDTSNAANPYEQTDGYSAKNDTEAEVISESILPKLFENDISPKEIAIIAPYKSQVANIKRFIGNSSLCKHKNIDVSTLDSFQGKEYDIIIFSFTRSSDHRKPEMVNGRKKFVKVGFLDDARRLNVAFSRAKKKLVLIGNAQTLVDGRSHFDFLFNYTELFKNLVRLSKQEEIGNFVSIADFHDFKIPFDVFQGKYKVGDSVVGKFNMPGKKEGKVFGLFFKTDGCDCLLPISLIPDNKRGHFLNLPPQSEVKLTVHEINKESKRISVKPFIEQIRVKSRKEIKTELWDKNISKYKTGMKIKATVVSRATFGYFLKMESGLEGLLHNHKIRVKKELSLGQEINVNLIKIDTVNMQISFSLT